MAANQDQSGLDMRQSKHRQVYKNGCFKWNGATVQLHTLASVAVGIPVAAGIPVVVGILVAVGMPAFHTLATPLERNIRLKVAINTTRRERPFQQKYLLSEKPNSAAGDDQWQANQKCK